MHHETTLNLPTPSSKNADRIKLAAWLAEAGVVQVIESPIEARPLVNGQWTAQSMTIITNPRSKTLPPKKPARTGRPQGTTADDTHLVERARAMADLGLSRYAASRALNIGCDRLARIERANNITFKKAE
jgi:hypothetical protein